jgi:hypothetical protein
VRRAGLVALALLAGCGGGDKGGDKAAYVRQGDAICARYAKAIAKLGQPTTLGAIGTFITSAMPVLTRTVGEVEKLDPPSELSDEFGKFRDAARAAVDRAQRLRNAAEAGDSTQVKALLAEAAKASKVRVGLAKDAGLQTCAQL